MRKSRRNRPEILLRGATDADLDMIIDNWLSWHASSNRGQDRISQFYMHRQIIYHMLTECVTMIACNPLKTDNVYGWANAKRHEFEASGREHTVLQVNMVYVKVPFRQHCVATTLMERAFGYRKGERVIYTHQSFILKYLRKHKHVLRYTPHVSYPGCAEIYLAEYKRQLEVSYGTGATATGSDSEQRVQTAATQEPHCSSA